MAKEHGSNIKDHKRYEALRKRGTSKSRAAATANTPDASSKDGKRSDRARAAGRVAAETVLRSKQRGVRAARSHADLSLPIKRSLASLRDTNTSRRTTRDASRRPPSLCAKA